MGFANVWHLQATVVVLKNIHLFTVHLFFSPLFVFIFLQVVKPDEYNTYVNKTDSAHSAVTPPPGHLSANQKDVFDTHIKTMDV